MIKIVKLALVFFFFLFGMNVQAQYNFPQGILTEMLLVDSVWQVSPILRGSMKNIFKAYNIKYTPSDRFILQEYPENFDSLQSIPALQFFPRTRKKHNKWFGPVLESKDKDCTVVFTLGAFHLYLKSLKEEGKVAHLNTIRHNMTRILNKEYDKITLNDIKKEIRYLSEKDAMDGFNADTLITYKIALIEGEQFRNRYNHCDVLVLYKRDVGECSIYCFYTDRGYIHKKMYQEELTKMFKFE